MGEDTVLDGRHDRDLVILGEGLGASRTCEDIDRAAVLGMLALGIASIGHV